MRLRSWGELEENTKSNQETHSVHIRNGYSNESAWHNILG